MIEDIALDLYERQQKLQSNRNKFSYIIKDTPSQDLVHWTFGIAVFGSLSYSSLSNICISMGENVLRALKANYTTEQAIHIGWFILCSYVNLKLFNYAPGDARSLKSKKWRRPTYRLNILEPDKVLEVYESMFSEEDPEGKWFAMCPHVEPQVWEEPVNETGVGIIKGMPPGKLHTFNNKYLFDTLNKCNQVGWRINQEVWEVYKYYLNCDKNICDYNPFKHRRMDPQTKKERQISQSHEIRSRLISKIAEMNQSRTFYNLYNLDFRGRIYPNTQFLNEQSNDSARGLLQFSEGIPIGKGLNRFMVYGSQCYGSNMQTTDERIQELKGMDRDILAIANDPYSNTSWMRADKPFCWLAWCFEYRRYKKYPALKSHLPIYCDGSCNGSQHLSALSLDETIGKLVNLTNNERPEDLYSYVSDELWKELVKLQEKLTQEDIDKFESLWAEGREMKERYEKLLRDGDKEEANEVWKDIEEYRAETRELRDKLFPVYWNMINNHNLRRKVVKRPAMTLAYAATPYGFGKQIYDDTRGLSDHLDQIEPVWAFKLGRLLHETCHNCLKGPAELLRIFKILADYNNENNKCISWHAPVTNFQVSQSYYKYQRKRLKLKHGRREVQLYYRVPNKDKVDKRRQSNGTPPNLVHSLDAAHMSMVITNAPFDVACVHDSFGCHAANADELHRIIREQFINIYRQDPLPKLIEEITKGLDSPFDLVPKPGKLNIEEIRNAEFAFY